MRSASTTWRTRAIRVTIALLLAWQVIEAMRISPHFLAYFNALAGGPAEGYQHLLDSSLDWGQDLPGLRRWLDANNGPGPRQEPVYLAYFGNAPPAYYGIHGITLPGFPDLLPPRDPPPLRGGIYCISANLLQSLYLIETPGPWTPAYEARYQDVLYNLRVLGSTASDARARAALIKQTGPEFWPRVFALYERLRVGRLAAYLRSRRPEASIGYSIFVYRLTDEDVMQALYAPVPSASH